MRSVASICLVLALAGCGGAPRNQPAPAGTARPAPPRITQFYAGQGAIASGGRTLLCYGVENAVAVRLSPEVERLSPAVNRCIEIRPARTTTYTLTAEGAEKTAASATLTVTVSAAARSPAPKAPSEPPGGPRIHSFTQQKKADITLLCYEVEGAEAVSVEPGALPRTAALRGCFGVAPRAPADYTLTAHAAGGRTARRTLRVVP